MSDRPKAVTNPNHPMSQWVAANLDKIVAILVMKSDGAVTITASDIEAFGRDHDGWSVAVRTENDLIELWLMDPAEAKARVEREGGLPS